MEVDSSGNSSGCLMPTTIVKDRNIVDELYSHYPHSGAKEGE